MHFDCCCWRHNECAFLRNPFDYTHFALETGLIKSTDETTQLDHFHSFAYSNTYETYVSKSIGINCAFSISMNWFIDIRPVTDAVNSIVSPMCISAHDQCCVNWCESTELYFNRPKYNDHLYLYGLCVIPLSFNLVCPLKINSNQFNLKGRICDDHQPKNAAQGVKIITRTTNTTSLQAQQEKWGAERHSIWSRSKMPTSPLFTH